MKNKFDAIKEIKYDFIEFFNKNEIEIDEFCKVLSLCHASKTRRIKKANDEGLSVVHDYLNFEDETILNFARKCGYSFEAALKYNQANAYKILNHGKMEYYQVLGINYSTSKRERFSIVFKDEPMNTNFERSCCCATLYIRGSFEAMKDILLLKECEKDTLKEMTASFTELGYYTKIYGKKNLTSEETESYNKLIQVYKSSLTMEDYEVEKILSKFEENVSFLTMICLESKQEEGVEKIIESLKAAKIKTSLLSGSDLANTLIGAYKTGILSTDQEFFHLNGETFEAVLFGLKTLLHKLKKIIQKNVDNEDICSSKIKENSMNSDILINYCLVLSFKTFSLILNNQYLCPHFLFVLHLANGIVGYEFSQSGKKKLLKMLKNNFIDEPNILSIGSSYYDTEMFSASTIAIEIKQENNLCSYSGDIITQNKKILNDILFQEAFIYKERFMFILSNMIYFMLLLTWPTLFSLFCNESSFFVFLRQEVICKIFFFMGLINVVLISFSSETKKEYEFSKEVPIISFFQKQNEKKMFLNLIIIKCFLSFVESLFIYMIWRIYEEFNEQDILSHSLFLPKILQFLSFINFYINVIYLYIKLFIFV